MKDFFNREYSVGDYVFCAVNTYSSISTYVGKVIKINEKTITIKRVWSWRDKPTTAVMQCPERHIIVPKELALEAEPRLEDV